jgi:hypothetical protein
MSPAPISRQRPILEYSLSSADPQELQAAVARIWSERIKTDSALRSKLGARPPDSPPAVPFRVKVTQGADPASVTLLILVGTSAIHLGTTALRDLWKSIWLPKLKRAYGTLREKTPARARSSTRSAAARPKRAATRKPRRSR